MDRVIDFLAYAVAGCFVWSLCLFLRAIVQRSRRQEAGFVYTLVGGVLFVVAYSDRLGLSSEVLATVPGARSVASLPASSAVILVGISGVYLLRIGAFLRLFSRLWFEEGTDLDGYTVALPERELSEAEEDELLERVNDYIVRPLSYLTLSLSFAALVTRAYDLNGLTSGFTIVVMIALYFVDVVFRQFRGVVALARTVWRQGLDLAQRVVTPIVLFFLTVARLKDASSARTELETRANLRSVNLAKRAIAHREAELRRMEDRLGLHEPETGGDDGV